MRPTTSVETTILSLFDFFDGVYVLRDVDVVSRSQVEPFRPRCKGATLAKVSST